MRQGAGSVTQAIPSYPSDQRPLAGLWPPSSPASIVTPEADQQRGLVAPHPPVARPALGPHRSAAVLKRVAGLDGGGGHRSET